MKKLLVYLNEYKKECVLSPLFKLLEVLFELTVPLVVASMIDVGIAGANRRYVLFMGLALAGLAVGAWPLPLQRSILRQKPQWDRPAPAPCIV
jgi:ABC-type multidrug transport system fused ATPase/permease subunit